MFAFVLAAVNCYNPLLVADECEAFWLVEMVTCNVKIVVAAVSFRSAKAVQTQFQSGNCSSDCSSIRLDPSGMGSDCGNTRRHSLDAHDFIIYPLSFGSSECSII